MQVSIPTFHTHTSSTTSRMGHYFRVSMDNRDLNYDKYFIEGKVETQANESYTSHNTQLLDVDGTVKKILTTDYVQEALKG